MQGELKMKILAGFSILFVCLLLISAIPTASALDILNVEGDYVNEQVKVTLDKSAFVIFRMNNGTPIYAQGEEVYFIPRVTGELYIKALSGEERAIELVLIVEKPSDKDNNVATPPSVHIDVDYRYIGDIYRGDISFVSGMTVFDALDNASKRGGFSYNTKEASWGSTYVYKIAGIEEKSEGPTSGWMYWVNGVAPSVGCADKTLQNRDRVIWFWSASMDSVPPTEYPLSDSSIQTTTTLETKTIEVTKNIEVIEAGEKTSVTFTGIDITKITINANNTISNAGIAIQQIEKLANITNVSGIPYRYFNITTTNLTATDIATATIEFKVNKTWINESNIDETTITLNRYSNITGNWRALPTTKIEEDNTSLYFESETPAFSFFAVSGEKKTVSIATAEAPTAEATAIPVPLPKVTPVSSIPTPVSLSTHIHGFPGSLILIVIAVIVIGGIIIVVLKRKK